jgi:hypothetical protein
MMLDGNATSEVMNQGTDWTFSKLDMIYLAFDNGRLTTKT